MGRQQAILFAAGILVSAFSALLGGWLVKTRNGAGWVYYGAITLRMLALLAGCTLIYLLASPGASPLIWAYAFGVAVAWLVHWVVALVQLRE
jgi:hypothetical protein